MSQTTESPRAITPIDLSILSESIETGDLATASLAIDWLGRKIQEATDARNDITDEERAYRRYQSLAAVAKNAEAERQQLKEQIEPGMESGVVYGDDDNMLVFEYSSLVTFEWERALKSGAITPEVAKEFCRLTPVRKISSRKREPKGKLPNRAKLLAQAAGPQLMKALEGIKFFLTHHTATDVDSNAAIVAAFAALRAAHGLPEEETSV